MKEGLQTELLETLGNLSDKELKLFKWYLQKSEALDGLPAIPKSDLQTADKLEIVNLMINKYKPENALGVAQKILDKVKTRTSQSKK